MSTNVEQIFGILSKQSWLTAICALLQRLPGKFWSQWKYYCWILARRQLQYFPNTIGLWRNIWKRGCDKGMWWYVVRTAGTLAPSAGRSAFTLAPSAGRSARPAQATLDQQPQQPKTGVNGHSIPAPPIWETWETLIQPNNWGYLKLCHLNSSGQTKWNANKHARGHNRECIELTKLSYHHLHMNGND